MSGFKHVGRTAFMPFGYFSGEAYSYIPCLNDADVHVNVLEQLLHYNDLKMR